MSLTGNKVALQNNKETLQLLNFAKAATQNIKSALDKPYKQSKRKVNHKRYIQRRCRLLTDETRCQVQRELQNTNQSRRGQKNHSTSHSSYKPRPELSSIKCQEISLAKNTTLAFDDEMYERSCGTMKVQPSEMSVRQFYIPSRQNQLYHNRMFANYNEYAPPRLSHFDNEKNMLLAPSYNGLLSSEEIISAIHQVDLAPWCPPILTPTINFNMNVELFHFQGYA